MNCPGCGAPVAGLAEVCARCGTVEPGRAEAERAGGPSLVGVVLEGRYRVDAPLARGGMGEVYRGTDMRLHRPVAVKLLHEELRGNTRLVQRFVREAESVASLDHPNIVAVHSVGDLDGRPYLVMKLVGGKTLAEYLQQRGPLPLAEACDLAVQLCDGLAHVHAAGFVHRDVKPQNVMLDASGRCILLDFGILRNLESTLTSTGMMIGTPAYVAPEQARDGRAADARSDLYALGITFFEMLTGRLPFRAPSAVELLVKHSTEPPPRVRTLRPELPQEVEELLSKALAKTPDERFQTARELRRGVLTLGGGAAAASRSDAPPDEKHLSTASIAGEVVPSPRTTAHRRRGGRWWMAGMALLAAGAVLAVVLVARDDEPPRAPAPVAAAPEPPPPPVAAPPPPVAAPPPPVVRAVAPAPGRARPVPEKRAPPPPRAQPAPPRPAPVRNLAGTWSTAFDSNLASATGTMVLTQSGDRVLGPYTTSAGTFGWASGKIRGDAVEMTVTSKSGPCPGSYTVRGTMVADGSFRFRFRGNDCLGFHEGEGQSTRR